MNDLEASEIDIYHSNGSPTSVLYENNIYKTVFSYSYLPNSVGIGFFVNKNSLDLSS